MQHFNRVGVAASYLVASSLVGLTSFLVGLGWVVASLAASLAASLGSTHTAGEAASIVRVAAAIVRVLVSCMLGAEASYQAVEVVASMA